MIWSVRELVHVLLHSPKKVFEKSILTRISKLYTKYSKGIMKLIDISNSYSLSSTEYGFDTLELVVFDLSCDWYCVKLLARLPWVATLAIGVTSFTASMIKLCVERYDLIQYRLIHFLQLHRFLGSLDCSTYSGVSPKRFTLPACCDLLTQQSIKEWHKLRLGSSLVFRVIKRKMALTSTWLGFESEIDWCIEFVCANFVEYG